MELSYVTDWANLLFRWAHFVFGAAWIGTSFYFNWLNNNLRPPRGGDDDPEVGGELWSVHGGYFYRVLKYKVAPEELPKTLHWFKWEAYLTLLTGLCLLVVVYYLQADYYMVDKNVADLTTAQAIGIGVGTLAGGWTIYHLACKSPLAERPVAFAVIMFAGATGVAYMLTELLNPQAAYIHVGAMLGTCMALNVFFVIIPNQRVMVDALLEGREPDAAKGKEGAMRSLHNNYMTLPVLFIMVSNHFPMTFGHGWNWAVLAALAIGGASVRHWFNLHGRGRHNRWILPAAALALFGLVFVMSPYAQELTRDEPPPREGTVTFAEANQILITRCTPCHAAEPTYVGFMAPPKGVVLETPEQIAAQVANIKKMTIDTKVMPLGNLTQMTPDERALIGQWIAEGAPVE